MADDSVRLTAKDVTIEWTPQRGLLLDVLRAEIEGSLSPGERCLRVAVVSSCEGIVQCEYDLLEGPGAQAVESVFRFRKRIEPAAGEFNVALVVPTGIGCAIGGEAGDATPAARLLGSVCDRLVLHPNVVNASDLNEMPENAVYVEGSVLTRLLMGTVALRPVRQNRLLVAIESSPDPMITDCTVNAATGAAAVLGLDIGAIVQFPEPLDMEMFVSTGGRATGEMQALEPLVEMIRTLSDEVGATAVSIHSAIGVPGDTNEFIISYFQDDGGMVNPWGGVEAMLTHAVAGLLNVPVAHAPMVESRDEWALDVGMVDPRKAAEAASRAYLFCTLKGLHRSPRIVPLATGAPLAGDLAAEHVDCLVVPDGCVGLPVLAAAEQGITIIEVAENTNVMRNDMRSLLPEGATIHRVRSYLEAAGLIAALRASIAPGSLQRPMSVPFREWDSQTREARPHAGGVHGLPLGP